MIETTRAAKIVMTALESVQSDSIIHHLNIEVPAETILCPYYRYPGQEYYTDLTQMQIKLNQGDKNLYIIPTSLTKEPEKNDPRVISGTYKINHFKDLIIQHENIF